MGAMRMRTDSGRPTPVTVLTGALGSGKTTLLRKLIASDAAERIAVVINEFGEVGLDHLLVRNVTDNAVVLQNGCVCCTIRSDLRASFRELIDGRASGAIEPFDRVVLETTGLADPAPIVQTLIADPMLRNQMRLANVVCTVDCLHVRGQVLDQPEVLRQLAIADELVLTKTDMDGAMSADAGRSFLARLNPLADVSDANAPCFDPLRVLTGPQPGADSGDQDWLGRIAGLHHDGEPRGHGVDAGSAHAGVSSFVLRAHRRIDWTVFGVWLSAFAYRYGDRILRIKGLLDVPEAPGPIVLDVVRNVIHHPVHLECWPDRDHSSRIVFIVQDLDTRRIERALVRFLADAAVAASEPRSVQRVLA
ncbi:MAG: GTP-binding protein [Alphaproteobacteria bacterium]